MSASDLEARWGAVTRELGACLPDIAEDLIFILAHRRVNHYVQVAGESGNVLHMEAASNSYIEPPSARLTVEQYARMGQLGWQRATDDAPEVATTPPTEGGSPNFFVVWEGDAMAAAVLLVETLRSVYGVATPDDLHYKCFDNAWGPIVLQGFSVKRQG